MWSVNIESIIADATPGVAQVTYVYSNDDGSNRTKTIVERISDPTSLNQIAIYGINELNRVDAIAALITNPPLGVIDLSQPQPTQEQLDQQTYNQQRQDLIQAQQDLSLGLITQDDFNAQQAIVVTAKTNIGIKQTINPIKQ